MQTSDQPYQPKPEHKFSFGLWTVGNRGRDPFGDFVRPPCPPNELIALLARRFPKWMLPDDVICVDELPHTATGKLMKTRLREMFSNTKSSNNFATGND